MLVFVVVLVVVLVGFDIFVVAFVLAESFVVAVRRCNSRRPSHELRHVNVVFVIIFVYFVLNIVNIVFFMIIVIFAKVGDFSRLLTNDADFVSFQFFIHLSVDI